MMLDEELSTGERRQYFDVLQRSADRLLNMVTNYMDISLIVTGNMEVSLKWIEPVSILNELYTRYQRVAGPKNLNFSLSLPPGTAGRRFLTDQELLSKIMGHLLDNAIKFTTEGSVEYGFVIADEELRFFVRDTGNGIAEADRDFIFEHFSQAGQVGQAWHEGSGLGLSIAKGMVNMLGGRIWLKSTPGKGTTFFFALPGVLTPVVDGHLQRTAVKRNGTPVVLVAEDEESNLTLVSWYLEKENLEVVTVADGLQAVEACRKNEAIGLVLMDLKMPVMDGYKATAEIRTFAPRIPVIAVTAYALSGDMKKVMEAGFDDYLPKPFSREALHGCLKNFGMIG
jgi:CheY-like chemotaxis protein